MAKKVRTLLLCLIIELDWSFQVFGFPIPASSYFLRTMALQSLPLADVSFKVLRNQCHSEITPTAVS